MTRAKPATVLGVILAGGQSRRMGGGDKTLLSLGDKPILDHVIDRAVGQVDELVLNVNGDPARFERFNQPIIQDNVQGFAGPLAGIHAALAHNRDAVGAQWVASFASDAPFVPENFVRSCVDKAQSEQATIVLAQSNGRDHPVAGLWHESLLEPLAAFLGSGERKVDLFTAQHREARAAFAETTPGLDPFYNINRPEDLDQAKRFITV